MTWDAVAMVLVALGCCEKHCLENIRVGESLYMSNEMILSHHRRTARVYTLARLIRLVLPT